MSIAQTLQSLPSLSSTNCQLLISFLLWGADVDHFSSKMLVDSARRCSSLVIVLFLLLQSTPYSRGLKTVQTVSRCAFRLSSPSSLNALVPIKQITDNKKSSFEYEFTEKYEAGVMLTGTEVKSCRKGMVQLSDSVAEIIDGECWLLNCHIGYFQYQLYAVNLLPSVACTRTSRCYKISHHLDINRYLVFLQPSMIVVAD